MKLDRKYGIYFQNDDINQMYIDLLLNICPLCKEVSRNVDELRRHVRKNHDKQYCDICLKNLKIFPQEFVVYTRSDLVTHRKTGDVNNRSYKGHPQCDFCNERYFDNDAGRFCDPHPDAANSQKKHQSPKKRSFKTRNQCEEKANKVMA